MAVESATSNGTTDESHSGEIEKCNKGWLLKKTHYTKRWKQLWFHIRDGNLFYGVNEESTEKAINLVGAKVELLDGEDRFGWTITPRDSKRTFFLGTDAAEERQAWMTAICEAQLSSKDHNSNACVVQ
ncbi:pleckstrin homology-like domain-containing protein [Triplophysa rosa]|uniref:Differentially expressed in FDCP 6-like protein n=1 Tax=Triplophysa rosa TaxID=992332 RepID=A0A9W7TNM3_TRIRA|nr:pleckstrin homology-like domain-containing protein [Triplophysa rosa]KAI7799716.1 putative differentially expressed in FDCP 6-like protein [Triplophysa rosa]